MYDVMLNISVVMPNFNGRHLLERFLPSVFRALDNTGGRWEFIVVDNGSKDGSADFIRERYPGIKLVEMRRNTGFAKACNTGVKETGADIVILLNNDVEVKEDFLRPLLEHFKDSEVFAVNPKIIIEKKGKVDEGIKKLYFHHGMLYSTTVKMDANHAIFIPYATAGAMAFDKKKFLMLGGFDEIFSPFYWEDADLSYLAQKRGWKVLYEPRSMVIHLHEATTARFNKLYLNTIKSRNNFIFTWKNISDKGLIIRHLSCLPFFLLWNMSRGRFYLFFGFFWAALKLPAILSRRMRKRGSEKTDKEILDLPRTS